MQYGFAFVVDGFQEYKERISWSKTYDLLGSQEDFCSI